MTDSHFWLAHYRNGETFAEYDDDGNSRGFKSVDLDRLVALEYVDADTGKSAVRVDIPERARPILFRRRQVFANVFDESHAIGETLHVLGWQKTIRWQNVKAYFVLYEDGSVRQTSEDDF